MDRAIVKDPLAVSVKIRLRKPKALLLHNMFFRVTSVFGLEVARWFYCKINQPIGILQHL